MAAPSAFGYRTLTDQTRRKVWEHPKDGHLIEVRGGQYWDVWETLPGANTRDNLKTGLTRDAAIDYAGEVARSRHPDGTPGRLDRGSGDTGGAFDFGGGL
jgi:hypothetical protein